MKVPPFRPDPDVLNSAIGKGLPCGRVTIKIATKEAEYLEVLRLRYQVFNVELGEGIPENDAIGMDVDLYDEYCDHLLCLNTDNKIVGTYRLLYGPKRPKQGFYSETEFNLSALNLEIADCVELGRACVDPQHRNKTTLLGLLWGLHRYMMFRNANIMLGCASLPPMSHDDAEATFHELSKLSHDSVFPVTTLPHCDFRGVRESGIAKIPPLLSMYLEFGAHVVGRPAYDAVFRCHDVPVLFHMKKLSSWGSELLERFDKRLTGGEV